MKAAANKQQKRIQNTLAGALLIRRYHSSFPPRREFDFRLGAAFAAPCTRHNPGLHKERSFGVRQLAAAFLPARLLAGFSCGGKTSSGSPLFQLDLYRQSFGSLDNSQPASWLEGKRQQAAALQSFALRACG
jgi:hypothetical protein